jgi:hypothetical protein
MKKMGKYCKAYEIKQLMAYPGWAKKGHQAAARGNAEAATEEAPAEFYYLQENFTVTSGIFLDEGIVFEAVTPEWLEFCRNTLKFEVLVYDTK